MSEALVKEKFPRDSEKTRARLLEAALDLFSLCSYDKVRSRDIAAMASVDVALINRYFGSKRGLFEAALDELTTVRPKLQDGVERGMCEFFSQRISSEERHLATRAVRFLAFSAASPEVAPLLRERVSDELTRLTDHIGDGDRTTAMALMAYVLGMHTLLHILGEDHGDLQPGILLKPIQAILQPEGQKDADGSELGGVEEQGGSDSVNGVELDGPDSADSAEQDSADQDVSGRVQLGGSDAVELDGSDAVQLDASDRE